MRTAIALAILSLASIAVAQSWGDPVLNSPPLDSPVFYRRSLNDSVGIPGTTHEILSLYMEAMNGSETDFPWPLYIELRTDHAQGADGVGITSQLRNEGSGWATAYHADVLASGSGTSIGYNVEVVPMGSGRTIGVNVHAKASYGAQPSVAPTNEGINVTCDAGASFVDGVHFTPESSGQNAIAIEGDWTVGVYSTAPIVVTRGTVIALEESRAITVAYQGGRIVFRNRSRVLGYLVTDATASGGRLN